MAKPWISQISAAVVCAAVVGACAPNRHPGPVGSGGSPSGAGNNQVTNNQTPPPADDCENTVTLVSNLPKTSLEELKKLNSNFELAKVTVHSVDPATKRSLLIETSRQQDGKFASPEVLCAKGAELATSAKMADLLGLGEKPAYKGKHSISVEIKDKKVSKFDQKLDAQEQGEADALGSISDENPKGTELKLYKYSDREIDTFEIRMKLPAQDGKTVIHQAFVFKRTDKAFKRESDQSPSTNSSQPQQ